MSESIQVTDERRQELRGFLISLDIKVITKKYKLVDYTDYFEYSLTA